MRWRWFTLVVVLLMIVGASTPIVAETERVVERALGTGPCQSFAVEGAVVPSLEPKDILVELLWRDASTGQTTTEQLPVERVGEDATRFSIQRDPATPVFLETIRAIIADPSWVGELQLERLDCIPPAPPADSEGTSDGSKASDPPSDPFGAGITPLSSNWFLEVRKEWEGSGSFVPPGVTTTIQVQITSPNGTPLLTDSCVVESPATPMLTETDRCYFFLQERPPVGSQITVTETIPSGWTAQPSSGQHTIPILYLPPPPYGNPNDHYHGFLWRCYYSSCVAQFINRPATSQPVSAQFTVSKQWIGDVVPPGPAQLTVSSGANTLTYDCPPPTDPAQLGTPIACTPTDPSAMLPGLTAWSTVEVTETAGPSGWVFFASPSQFDLHTLPCEWISQGLIRCQLGPFTNEKDPPRGFIKVRKRWTFVDDPGVPAQITVTIGAQVTTVTCPYNPDQLFVDCAPLVPVPSGGNGPATYDVAEDPIPGVRPLDGIGHGFTWNGVQTCPGRVEWDPFWRPICPHDVVNGPDGVVVYVGKWWWDPEPATAPPAQPVPVTVSVAGSPVGTLTCPAGAQPYEQVSCGRLLLPHGTDPSTIDITESPLSGWRSFGALDVSQYVCPTGLPCRAFFLFNHRSDRVIVRVQKHWDGTPPGTPATVHVTVNDESHTLQCPGAAADEECGTVVVPGQTEFRMVRVVESPPAGWTVTSGEGTWDGQGQLPAGWFCAGSFCTVYLVNEPEPPVRLRVTKRAWPFGLGWQYGPPPGTQTTIRLTFYGPTGQTLQRTITCYVWHDPSGMFGTEIHYACNPRTFDLPGWVRNAYFHVTEDPIPGVTPVTGVGWFHWNQDDPDRLFSCSSMSSYRDNCLLEIRNANAQPILVISKGWFGNSDPPATPAVIHVAVDGTVYSVACPMTSTWEVCGIITLPGQPQNPIIRIWEDAPPGWAPTQGTGFFTIGPNARGCFSSGGGQWFCEFQIHNTYGASSSSFLQFNVVKTWLTGAPNQTASIELRAGDTTLATFSCPGTQSTNESCGSATIDLSGMNLQQTPLVLVETPPPGWEPAYPPGTWDGTTLPPNWSCNGSQCTVSLHNRPAGTRLLRVRVAWLNCDPALGCTVPAGPYHVTITANGQPTLLTCTPGPTAHSFECTPDPLVLPWQHGMTMTISRDPLSPPWTPVPWDPAELTWSDPCPTGTTIAPDGSCSLTLHNVYGENIPLYVLKLWAEPPFGASPVVTVDLGSSQHTLSCPGTPSIQNPGSVLLETCGSVPVSLDQWREITTHPIRVSEIPPTGWQQVRPIWSGETVIGFDPWNGPLVINNPDQLLNEDIRDGIGSTDGGFAALIANARVTSSGGGSGDGHDHDHGGGGGGGGGHDHGGSGGGHSHSGFGASDHGHQHDVSAHEPHHPGSDQHGHAHGIAEHQSGDALPHSHDHVSTPAASHAHDPHGNHSESDPAAAHTHNLLPATGKPRTRATLYFVLLTLAGLGTTSLAIRLRQVHRPYPVRIGRRPRS